MYYPDELVDQVRNANDIVDVVGQCVQLKKAGRDYIGLCPFHNEKTPSFTVSRVKQIFYCFGCHKGGNVITFVEEYGHKNFPEAVEELAQRAGIALPEREYSAQERKRREELNGIRNANKLAAAYYYYQLRAESGKAGMDYLKGRGLSDETMKNFGLGFAGRSDGGLYRYLKQQGISDDILRRSGLMKVDERRGQIYDKFYNRVMFPILDLNSRVIGFGGRVMGDGRPKYLNSPETEIFDKSRNLYGLNLARRSSRDCLILCEGYMDVIAMHQAGFTNAVASLGTALTRQHCELLSRFSKKVILSYDSDNAGVNAAMRAIPMLRAAGITPQILHLEPYKDPDEFVKGLGAGALEERIKGAQNAFLFEASVIQRKYDLSDPDSKTGFFREIAGKIAAFPLEMERQNYIDAIAREYMIEARLLKEMVSKQLMLGPLPGQGRGAYGTGALGRNTSFATGGGKKPGGSQGTSAGAGTAAGGNNPAFAGNASHAFEEDAVPGGSMPDAFYEGYDPGAGYPEDDSFGRPADWADFPEDPAQYYGVEAEEASDFYEDSETGDRYQAPRVATGRRRGESVREQGVSTSRKLLLNYIARYPAIFPLLSRYVSPEDFGDGLTGRVAELVFRQMESGGKVDEAVILSRFVQPAEQQEIAQIFRTLEPASGTAERRKAVLETLRKVYQAAPARTEDGSDAMMAAIKKKKTLEEISRLKLNL